MNMAGAFPQSFAGARPVAQHCAELIRTAQPDAKDRMDEVAPWCRDLGLELTQELSQMFSGGKLRVSVAGPELVSGGACFDRIGPIAANSLLRCSLAGEKVLLSIDFATALALTDCSFGGDGQLGDDIPAQLPASAEIMVRQLGGMIAQAIALTNGSAEQSPGDVLVRSDTASRLKPFAAETQVAIFTISIVMNAGNPWDLSLAFALDDLPGLLPGTTTVRPVVRPASGAKGQINGAFVDLPLPVEAVLSEIDLSLSRLGRLSPGDEIPLSIPHELALRVGDDVLAYGRIGTAGNRMALQLTRIEGRSHAEAGRQPTKEKSR